MTVKTHRPNRHSRHTSDRGAILIQVAAGSLVLIAFSMFVVDYGVLWVGRHQAQNAADAGAMAGAVALAFDNPTDTSDTGPAKVAANAFALANDVWGEDPINDISSDVTFPPCPDDGSNTCVRVDVYRNQARGNPLPMLFGLFAGLSDQGVRATATAQAAFGNASDCLKPFAIPDKWQDNYDETAPIDGIFTPDDKFERTEADTGVGGPAGETPLANPDSYTAPDDVSPGTGYTVAADYGVRVTLKAPGPADALNPGFFFPLRLPMPDGSMASGGSDYEWNIANCNGTVIEVPTTLPNEPGNMIGPTAHGMEDLVALDPYAYWDDNLTATTLDDKVANSCAYETPACGPRSPRIVAVPVFDTQTYWDGKVNGLVVLRIVNILGFFVENISANEVTGVLTTVPGLKTGSSGLNGASSFMRTVQLVR